jgi:hypothetical protein
MKVKFNILYGFTGTKPEPKPQGIFTETIFSPLIPLLAIAENIQYFNAKTYQHQIPTFILENFFCCICDVAPERVDRFCSRNTQVLRSY